MLYTNVYLNINLMRQTSDINRELLNTSTLFHVSGSNEPENNFMWVLFSVIKA